MTETRPDPRVEAFLNNAGKWRAELEQLRAIVRECGLAEQVKWGQPCYTSDNRNIVLIHGFKEYCALLFFKGALLQDPNGILIQQTENVQAGRQIRFTDLRQIVELAPILKNYIRDAVEVEKSGRKVTHKTTAEFAVTAEFQNRLDADPAVKAAFQALTPGRQRAYLLHFSSPKLSKTREARIEKCLPQILAGKGLND